MINDLIFGTGKELVSASANFVENYWSSFVAIHSCPEVDSKNEGKGPLSGLKLAPNPLETQLLWQPPPSDYIKINADASFVESISASSTSVARDSSGKVLVSSWDYNGLCKRMEEAEL